MKRNTLILLSALCISACGSSGGDGNSMNGIAASANPSEATNPVAQPATNTNSTIFTGGVDSGSSTTTNTQGGNTNLLTTVAPTVTGGGTTNTPVVSDISILDGQITMFNDFDGSSDVNIAVRNTTNSTTMAANGSFEIELPSSDEDRNIILDITGDSIIPESIDITIPAETTRLAVIADVASRTSPVEFTLADGGELGNQNSPTNVSVTVPANAFMFTDGTLAVGDADIQITEIDINDLDGDSAWAPNLTGINEDTNVTSGLQSYGMSEFHFSQNGQKLQLRPGMTATIKTNLMTSTLLSEDLVLVDAEEGMTIPLWYYDTTDMIWKEEGESIVVADAESPSGFSLVGEVSHFSYWNHDRPVPRAGIRVFLETVDQFGQPYTGLTVTSFHAKATVKTVRGNGWSYVSNSTSNRQLTPDTNWIAVTAPGQGSISNAQFNSGSTDMHFTVSDVSFTGEGEIKNLPASKSKTFNNNDADNSVTIQLVVERPIPQVLATVVIQPVSETGVVLNNVTVLSYTATAQSSGGSTWTDTINMTPSNNRIIVEGNTQARIDAGETITTTMSVDNIVLKDANTGDENPTPISKVFMSTGNDNVITFQVVVKPE